MRPSLPEDDVPWHDELRRRFFRAETFPRPRGGFVGPALGRVRGETLGDVDVGRMMREKEERIGIQKREALMKTHFCPFFFFVI